MTTSGKDLMAMTLGGERAWEQCSACGEEFMALGSDGRCIGCEGRVEETKRQKAAIEARLVEMMGERGAEDYRFERFDRNVCPEAFYAAWDFHLGEVGGSNLLLCGPAGTGKSHLAGAITRKFMEELGPLLVEYQEAIPLMRWFRMRSRGEEEDEIKRLARLDVLVLDDLGAEKDTEHTLGRLYEIVHARYKAKRNGLVVTTNLSPSLLSEKLDDDRITSRLLSMCKVVKIDAPDYRQRRNR